LVNLAQAFHQPGSAGIISSSFQLRTHLSVILFLFNDNAARLFSQVKRECLPHVVPLNLAWDLEAFPTELERLAQELRTFLKNLHEFPELTHEVSIGIAVDIKVYY
jgi:hypothetical protein